MVPILKMQLILFYHCDETYWENIHSAVSYEIKVKMVDQIQSKAPASQLVNAEVNSGNSSTSNYTLQQRIRECHAGMECDLKVTKHYSHCVDPENTL